MAKIKTAYFCQHCGARSVKWMGKCPSCNEWNTYVEEVVEKESKTTFSPSGSARTTPSAQKITDVSLREEPRIPLPDQELNRIFGGGVVPGSVVLFAGEPGIGKSTLLLQVAVRFKNKKILYVSGEESVQQVRMRAERIGIHNPDCFILAETQLENIFRQIEDTSPDLLVIDSIQTVYTSLIESSPGSVSQIRECTAHLLRYAKDSGIPVLLIGHITKEGSIAGPKVLEHMVDTVMQFEGDRHHIYRIVRVAKNRFGSTAELGIYEMQGDGLREVTNPSEILISRRDGAFSGIAISAAMEGIRPMLIETQALVSSAVYGTPQRSATGFDLRRLNMLLAVLEKRCGFRLASKDVFLNIAGGIRVEDPAIDLSVICAVLSSSEDIPLPPNVCFTGEVGLSGEIRAVTRADQRISEAEKLGFEKIFVSGFGPGSGKKIPHRGIEVVAVNKVEDAFRMLFG